MNEQRSPEWFAEREGKLTASMFGQAAGLGPGSRQQLWRRLFKLEVFEGNEATQWGEKHEPVAAAEWKLHFQNLQMRHTGFIRHPEHEWLGASPDILIEDDMLGEIKCPFNQQIYPAIPPYYMAQVQGQLEVANKRAAHFICWTPAAIQVWAVQRSHEYWDWLHLRLADFWTWVQAGIEPPREARAKPEEIPPVTTQVIYSTAN